jgi:hypothetical protein
VHERGSANVLGCCRCYAGVEGEGYGLVSSFNKHIHNRQARESEIKSVSNSFMRHTSSLVVCLYREVREKRKDREVTFSFLDMYRDRRLNLIIRVNVKKKVASHPSGLV